MYKHFSCSMYFIIINAFEFVLPAIVESIEFILIFLLISIILGIQFISEKTWYRIEDTFSQKLKI